MYVTVYTGCLLNFRFIRKSLLFIIKPMLIMVTFTTWVRRGWKIPVKWWCRSVYRVIDLLDNFSFVVNGDKYLNMLQEDIFLFELNEDGSFPVCFQQGGGSIAFRYSPTLQWLDYQFPEAWVGWREPVVSQTPRFHPTFSPFWYGGGDLKTIGYQKRIQCHWKNNSSCAYVLSAVEETRRSVFSKQW